MLFCKITTCATSLLSRIDFFARWLCCKLPSSGIALFQNPQPAESLPRKISFTQTHLVAKKFFANLPPRRVPCQQNHLLARWSMHKVLFSPNATNWLSLTIANPYDTLLTKFPSRIVARNVTASKFVTHNTAYRPSKKKGNGSTFSAGGWLIYAKESNLSTSIFSSRQLNENISLRRSRRDPKSNSIRKTRTSTWSRFLHRIAVPELQIFFKQRICLTSSAEKTLKFNKLSSPNIKNWLGLKVSGRKQWSFLSGE